MAISAARKRATARYKKRHPEKAKMYQSHSFARIYINRYADKKGLDELEQLIVARRAVLDKEEE